jgi:hypothetical protein
MLHVLSVLANVIKSHQTLLHNMTPWTHIDQKVYKILNQLILKSKCVHAHHQFVLHHEFVLHHKDVLATHQKSVKVSSALMAVLISIFFCFLFACQSDSKEFKQTSDLNSETTQSTALGVASSNLLVSDLHHNNTTHVEVIQLTVADKIRQHKPIGVAPVFQDSIGVLWGFVHIKTSGSIHLSLRWWYQDQLKAEFPLLYTQASTLPKWNSLFIQPSDQGQWAIDIYDEQQNKVLARHEFEISNQVEQKSSARNSQFMPSKKVLDHISQAMVVIPPKEITSTSNHKNNTAKSKITVQLKSSDPITDNLQKESKDHIETNQIENAPLIVERLIIARSIRARRPIDISQSFSTDAGRVWGYIEVNNPTHSDWVWMEWWHKEQRKSRLRIRVGQSKRWRTWSWQRLHPWDAGTWEVRVLNANHKVIKRTHFMVNHTL